MPLLGIQKEVKAGTRTGVCTAIFIVALFTNTSVYQQMNE